MSYRFETFDQLPKSAHDLYARGQEELDEVTKAMMGDAATVTPQVEIDVTEPAVLSTFERALGVPFNRPLAEFATPIGYRSQRKGGLFTHTALPGIGGEEKKEDLIARLEQSTSLLMRSGEAASAGK